MTLDQEADIVVREMTELGASFDVSEASRGSRGSSWYYAAAPTMREPLRRYKAQIDLTRAGFNEAMVRAVKRAAALSHAG